MISFLFNEGRVNNLFKQIAYENQGSKHTVRRSSRIPLVGRKVQSVISNHKSAVRSNRFDN